MSNWKATAYLDEIKLISSYNELHPSIPLPQCVHPFRNLRIMPISIYQR